jgi:hypothetical protein
MAPSRPLTQRQAAIKHGWRSGLEEKVGAFLASHGVDYAYEETTLRYNVPPRPAKYTPDFILPNGIIIETKGRWLTADRQKMALVKEQHPALDIRMVFSRSKATISKTSATTYAMWCVKHGFPYADRFPPEAWLSEPPNEASLAALKEIMNNG